MESRREVVKFNSKTTARMATASHRNSPGTSERCEEMPGAGSAQNSSHRCAAQMCAQPFVVSTLLPRMDALKPGANR